MTKEASITIRDNKSWQPMQKIKFFKVKLSNGDYINYPLA